MKRYQWLPALCMLVASSCFAGEMFDGKKLSPNNVNLSAQKFLDAFSSADAIEREKAKLYLLGVMDSTENKSWCDYQTFKTISIYDRIIFESQKLTSEQLAQRASQTIEQILSSKYPCRKKK